MNFGFSFKVLRPESHQISITFFDQFKLVFKSSQTHLSPFKLELAKGKIQIYKYIYTSNQIKLNRCQFTTHLYSSNRYPCPFLLWEEDSPQFSRKLYMIPFWGIHGICWAYGHAKIEGDVLLRQHCLVFKHNVLKEV